MASGQDSRGAGERRCLPRPPGLSSVDNVSALVRLAYGEFGTRKGDRVLAYIITEACIGTKNTACVGVCPVDCIYDADDQFVINPAECIDCSMCMPECPVEAIYPGDEVPEDMQHSITRAAEFDYSTTAPGVELN